MRILLLLTLALIVLTYFGTYLFNTVNPWLGIAVIGLSLYGYIELFFKRLKRLEEEK